MLIKLGPLEHICLLLLLFLPSVFALSSESHAKMSSTPLHNAKGFLLFLAG